MLSQINANGSSQIHNNVFLCTLDLTEKKVVAGSGGTVEVAVETQCSLLLGFGLSTLPFTCTENP